jgi:hypothetical protein
MTPEPIDDSEQPAMPVEQAIELHYAPPIKGGRLPLMVFVGGAISSALAVLLVYCISQYGKSDFLSWHVYYIVPAGTLIVAVIAGVGYLVGSQASGVRVKLPLVWVAGLVQIFVYGLAEYVQFAPHHYIVRSTRMPMGFLDYLHFKSMSWVWVNSTGRHSLGAFGYVYRVIDVVTFAVVGMFLAGSAAKAPYCDLCQVFLKRKRIALFPASQPYAKLKGMTLEQRREYQLEQQEHVQESIEGAELMLTLAEAGDLTTLRDLVAGVKADQRSIRKLPCRVDLSIETCPGCRASKLRTGLLVGKMYKNLGERQVSAEFLELAPSGKKSK